MAADRDGHVAAAAVQFVGELHAGGGRAHDEDTAGGDIVGAAVVGGDHLVDSPGQVTGSRREWPVGRTSRWR